MLFDGMRCTTCGTDNEPDSRFCGHCGAKVTGSVSPGAFTTKPGPGRVAPTQKIPPGSGFASQANGAQPATASGKVRHQPPSMPPPMQPQSIQTPAPASVIPRTSSVPPSQPSGPTTVVRPSGAQPARAASSPRPAASAPSIGTSIPRKGRNWPLIVILFIIDLGLAGSGAFLLQRGLIRDDEVPTVKASKP